MTKNILLVIVYALISTSALAQTKGTRPELNSPAGVVPDCTGLKTAQKISLIHSLHLGRLFRPSSNSLDSEAGSCVDRAHENNVPFPIGIGDLVHAADCQTCTSRVHWGISGETTPRSFQWEDANGGTGNNNLLFEFTLRFK